MAIDISRSEKRNKKGPLASRFELPPWFSSSKCFLVVCTTGGEQCREHNFQSTLLVVCFSPLGVSSPPNRPDSKTSYCRLWQPPYGEAVFFWVGYRSRRALEAGIPPEWANHDAPWLSAALKAGRPPKAKSPETRPYSLLVGGMGAHAHV